MAKKKWPAKDPNEDLDYRINWADKIGTTDAIVGSVWGIVTEQVTHTSPDTNLSMHDEDIVDGEITSVGADAEVGVEGTTVTDGATEVWLRGGQVGLTYEIINRITTQGGRIFDQTVFIQIKQK